MAATRPAEVLTIKSGKKRDLRDFKSGVLVNAKWAGWSISETVDVLNPHLQGLQRMV